MLTAALAVAFLAFVLAVLAFGYAGRKESLKPITVFGDQRPSGSEYPFCGSEYPLVGSMPLYARIVSARSLCSS